MSTQKSASGQRLAGLKPIFVWSFGIAGLLAACAPHVPGFSGVEHTLYAGEAPIEEAWVRWSRDDNATFDFSSDRRTGERSIRVAYPDLEPVMYFDWSLESRQRLDVVPGQQWTASAWVKFEDTRRVGLEIIAYTEGEVVGNWQSGFAAAFGTGDWQKLEASATIPPGTDQVSVRVVGSGLTAAWIDDVRIREGGARRTAPPKPQVRGWAFDQERVEERLDRGLIALPLEEGPVYLRWRLLTSDAEGTGFNVYRVAGNGEPERLNDAPLTATTDFLDATADLSRPNSYFVRTGEGEESARFDVPANPEIKPYLSITLDREETTFQKVAIGDLNGDGRFDFVIKTPNVNVDPHHPPRYWRPSETTYQLEAYLSDGTFLWRKDLGWNIESGIWYSPYIVYDFDGDGRAEVAVKTAPVDRDLRDTEPDNNGIYGPGRVRTGPEYLSILDGMTGEEKARTDWPSREGLGSYAHASRNLMAVAFLDGKTPALVLMRGKYAVTKLVAYQYHNGSLAELWQWNSTEEPGGLYNGQGGHFIHTADLDGDGRDAIMMGSAVISSNGEGLWTTGMGHPDNMWLGNIDPTRDGLEVYYGIEGSRVKGSIMNGVSLRDARTGALLWGLDERTFHVHGRGLVANIDARHAGMEAYSGESGQSKRWLHSSRGELLATEVEFNHGLSPAVVYWNADPERELLVGNRIFSYPDETIFEGVEGHQAAWLDLLGDWREEIITSVPGELRIYLTTIPAADRRTTLMQDPLYRSGVAHLSMGYGIPPTTSYYIGRSEQVSGR